MSSSDIRDNEYVRALIECDLEVVPASMIAPIIRMHPSTMIDHVRKGEWNLCATVISGDHVKFFRRDFLRKAGLIDAKDELIMQVLEELKELRRLVEFAMKGAETNDQEDNDRKVDLADPAAGSHCHHHMGAEQYPQQLYCGRS